MPPRRAREAWRRAVPKSPATPPGGRLWQIGGRQLCSRAMADLPLVLVTGVSGFVAGHVALALLEIAPLGQPRPIRADQPYDPPISYPGARQH